MDNVNAISSEKDGCAFAKIFLEPVVLQKIVNGLTPLELPALAQTCHSLYQPAITLLWRDLASSIRLLMLIPRLHFMGGKWRLDGPLLPNDCIRFDIYAPFVHSILSVFSSIPSGPVDIDPLIFVQLFEHRSHRSVFPQLRLLIIPSHFISFQLNLHPFLSDSLREASLSGFQYTHSHLVTLVDNAPKISRLSLSGPIEARSLDIVPQLRFLSHLTICLPKGHSGDGALALHQFLRQSSTQPCLSSLSLSIPDDLVLKPLPTSSLGGIRFLELHTGVNNMDTVLSATNDLLKVVLTLHSDGEEWTACLDSLVQNSLSTLHSVIMKTHGILDFQSCLSPLLSVCGLRALHVENSSRSSLALFDSDTAAIVNSWPLLEEFVLPAYKFNIGNLTNESLKLLAWLPKLCLLRIVINDDVVLLPQDRRFPLNPPSEFLSALISSASTAGYCQT